MKVKNILFNLIPASVEGFCCYECGETIHIGDRMITCADCGAVFCETCTKEGPFANHVCDEFEFEDECD